MSKLHLIGPAGAAPLCGTSPTNWTADEIAFRVSPNGCARCAAALARGDNRLDQVAAAILRVTAPAPVNLGNIVPGWEWDRRRRQEAASTAGATGWQMVGGINAGRLMAAGKPLDRSDDDSTVCVTPAGRAALAGFVGLDRMRDHGWTWDLDLQVRPGETRRDQGRREHERMCKGTPEAPCPFCHGRGSEDDVRERQSWQAPAPAPALTADDLHDLSRCLCVRCAGERRAARVHAEAVAGALGYHRSMVERARKIRDDRGEV